MEKALETRCKRSTRQYEINLEDASWVLETPIYMLVWASAEGSFDGHMHGIMHERTVAE